MNSLFNNIKTSVLSWFLHHANHHGKDQHFYKIKNRILAKYGKHICYEVQFIEGKKCNSCNGTGNHTYFDYHGFATTTTFCWNCNNGWFKRPTWNILALVRFGKYEFHQPFMRVYEDPQFKGKILEGYVDRHPTNLSRIAAFILLLAFEKGYLKRYYKESGIGWRSYWWLPRNWIHNIIHLIKHGRRSIPFHHKGVIQLRLERMFRPIPEPVYEPFEGDDLPF